MQGLDPFDDDAVTAGARDPGAHRLQTFGEIDDFRLACRVAEGRRARGERCRHHQVLGARDGDDVEYELRPRQVRRPGVDIAVVEIDFRAHGLQALDVLVDGPEPDCASAGKRDSRFAAAREQGAQRQYRCAHGLDHFVRSKRPVDFCRRQRKRAIGLFRANSHLRQERPHRAHIVELRHVGKNERLRGEQRGAKDRQRRVFGA